jgi:colicin import membrane protein
MSLTLAPVYSRALLVALCLHGLLALTFLLSSHAASVTPAMVPALPGPTLAVQSVDARAVTARLEAIEARARRAEQAKAAARARAAKAAKAAKAAEARRVARQKKQAALLKQRKVAARLAAEKKAAALKQRRAAALLAKQAALAKKARAQSLAEEADRLAAHLRAERLSQEQARVQQAASQLQQGEINRYQAQIVHAIAQQFLIPQGSVSDLFAIYRIRLGEGGVVLSAQLIRSSGSGALDRAARAAIYKASPLPVPAAQSLFAAFRSFELKVSPQTIIQT